MPALSLRLLRLASATALASAALVLVSRPADALDLSPLIDLPVLSSTTKTVQDATQPFAPVLSPVAPVTGPVTKTVNDTLQTTTNTVGTNVNQVLTPLAPVTAPVTSVVDKTVTNVDKGVVAPIVTNVVAPPVKVVTNTVDSVVRPVTTQAVQPVTQTVGNVVTQVLVPVLTQPVIVLPRPPSGIVTNPANSTAGNTAHSVAPGRPGLRLANGQIQPVIVNATTTVALPTADIKSPLMVPASFTSSVMTGVSEAARPIAKTVDVVSDIDHPVVITPEIFQPTSAYSFPFMMLLLVGFFIVFHRRMDYRERKLHHAPSRRNRQPVTFR